MADGLSVDVGCVVAVGHVVDVLAGLGENVGDGSSVPIGAVVEVGSSPVPGAPPLEVSVGSGISAVGN